MEFNEYQKRALSTAIFPNDNSITYLSLALCGEAGEIADKVKKVIRDQNGKYSPPDLEAIAMSAMYLNGLTLQKNEEGRMPSLLVPLERSRLKTLSRSVTPGNTKLLIINQ